MRKIFKSKFLEDTKKIAISVADSLGSYRVICLYGEMGAGKTTFVKAFAKHLGVSSRVLSPTYTFVRRYEFGSKKLYHVDAYRIEDSQSDIESLAEIISQDNTIVLIEWAEKIQKILPEERIDIEFSYNRDNVREIIITKKG